MLSLQMKKQPFLFVFSLVLLFFIFLLPFCTTTSCFVHVSTTLVFSHVLLYSLSYNKNKKYLLLKLGALSIFLIRIVNHVQLLVTGRTGILYGRIALLLCNRITLLHGIEIQRPRNKKT